MVPALALGHRREAHGHGLLEAFGFPGAGGGRPFPTSAAQDTLDQNVLRTAGPSARSGGREGRGQRPSSGFGALQPPDLSLQPSGGDPSTRGPSQRLSPRCWPSPPPPLGCSSASPSRAFGGKIPGPPPAAQSPGSSLRTHSQLWGRLLFKSSPGDSDPQLASPGTHRPFLPRGSAAGGCAAAARLCLRPDPPREGEAAAWQPRGRAGPRNAQSGLPRGAPCVLRGPWVPLGAPGRY